MDLGVIGLIWIYMGDIQGLYREEWKRKWRLLFRVSGLEFRGKSLGLGLKNKCQIRP